MGIVDHIKDVPLNDLRGHTWHILSDDYLEADEHDFGTYCSHIFASGQTLQDSIFVQRDASTPICLIVLYSCLLSSSSSSYSSQRYWHDAGAEYLRHYCGSCGLQVACVGACFDVLN